MKALVLSITTGQGHNSTAKAICQNFEKLGIEARMLDTYGYINKFLAKTISEGYLLSVENAHGIYSKIYKHLENRKTNGDQNSVYRSLNKLLIRKIYKYIKSYNPDVIICTHVFAGVIVDLLKQNEKINTTSIGILTDFAFHPYWEELTHMDYIVTPNELLGLRAKKKFFSDDQILPIGIPIRPEFGTEIPKDEAKKQLGLDPNLKTILIMSGSMGFGNLEKSVRILMNTPHNFQILAVCGSNTKAKRFIDSMEHKKPVYCYGFVDNVDVMMSAADCIITKPGGLTTSEALAKELPMILIDPIPGQEERNLEFLVNSGAAIGVSDTFTLDEALYVLFTFPERFEMLRQGIRFIKKPQATENLCNFAKNLVKNKPRSGSSFRF